MITTFFMMTWVVGLIVATVIKSIEKWGWLDWYSTYRRPWMPVGDCKFCMAFWFSFPIVAILVTGLGIREWQLIFVPFASASVANWVNK